MMGNSGLMEFGNRQEGADMNTRRKIAFACNLLSAFGLAGFGLVYLFSSRFMPYHEVAVGVRWSDIDAPFQILLLALIKAAGAGFLCASLTLFILLFIPFREGCRWARWAIFAIGSGIIVPLIYVVLSVKLATPASPPLIMPIAGMILLTAGLLLSSDKEER
jgi:hypothetical protein